jgi:uncharacterized protein (DUF433 family)
MPVALAVSVGDNLTPVRLSARRKTRDPFAAWRDSLVFDPDIMCGEAVFPNSRLSVSHVGRMRKRGAPVTEILEDYPYLNEQDVRFAAEYVDSK